MLACGVDIEAKDIRGYTSLHMAAKEGTAEHCKVLLKNGANPNAEADPDSKGLKTDHSTTPLHLANTLEVVRTLLQFGADANAADGCDSDQIHSVLDNYLERNPQAVEELFNHGISTNGQELDSVDLQIYFDFDIFFKEGLKKSSKIPSIDENKVISTAICDVHKVDSLIIFKIQNNIGVDEMEALAKIAETGESFLLRHPLAEAYLYLKWQLIKTYFHLNCFLYSMFLIAFTSMVVTQAEMYNCRTNVTLVGLKCGNLGKLVFDDQSNAFNFLDIVKIYWKSEHFWWNKMSVILFGFFGVVTIFAYVFIILREICQASLNIKRYFTSMDNIFELAILIGVFGYFISLFTYPLASVHFGAWTIILAWIEMTYMLGRISNIGLFIYMVVHVLKTIIRFLLIYTPILLAFATAFFILLPNAESFHNYPSSWIKVSLLIFSQIYHEL